MPESSRTYTHTHTRTSGRQDQGAGSSGWSDAQAGCGVDSQPSCCWIFCTPATSPSWSPHKCHRPDSQPICDEAPAGRKLSADTHAGHSESPGSVGSGVGAGPGARCLHSPLSVTTFDISAANLTPLCFVTFAFSVQ